jgi:hypothetical protein
MPSDSSVSKYSAPTLITYGDMARLTAGGAGSRQENSGKDKTVTKRP